jgi:hypothetical protein
MTLPGSNLSLNQVNTELGRSATATIDLNDSSVRSLAQVGGSGTTIGMSSLLNKTYSFSFSFSGGTNLNLRGLALAAGWDQVAVLYATNNGTINSNGSSPAALTIDGAYARGVTFTNNAGIYGLGGAAAPGGRTSSADTSPGYPASTYGGPGGGGTAIAVGSAVTIYNNSTIGGGGGGGGASGNGKTYGTSPGRGGIGPTTVVVSCSGGAGGGGSGNGPNAGAAYGDFNTFSAGGYSTVDINSTGYASTAGSQTGGGTFGYGGAGRISNTIGYGTIAYVASNRGGTGGGQGGTGESGQPVINAGGSILSGAPNGGAGGGPAVTANYLVSWGAYGTINGSLS